MSSPGFGVEGRAQNFSDDCGIRVVEGRFLLWRWRWWLPFGSEGTPARLLILLLHMQKHKERQLMSIQLFSNLSPVHCSACIMHSCLLHVISTVDNQDVEDI
jgi:hypothetical protein